MPAWKRSTAWSSRAAKTGDGRPSYWAAPMTTIASAGRCSSRSPWSPDPEGRVAADDEDDGRPRDDERRARVDGPVADAQRPWHFLYLAPEPHQHGSLRPIRAPVGV